MNKLKLATVVSLIAFLAASGAIAQESNNAVTNNWRDTRSSINAIELQEDYKDIKATLISAEAGVAATRISVNERMMASGMIGHPLMDENHNRLGAVEDIIIAADGTGKLIVVNTSKLAGFPGKLKAYSYDAVVNRTVAGDVMMPLNQKVIDSAMDFSYTASGSAVMTVPAGFLRVTQLLDGDLISSDDKTLASIDNVKFLDGRVSMIIASYGRVLNLGGQRVAVNFSPDAMIAENNEINIKLSPRETEQLEDAKRISDARSKSTAPISLTN